jgi:hypothetical protein
LRPDKTKISKTPFQPIKVITQLCGSINRIAVTPTKTGVGEDAGKKEPSYTVGGNVN